MALSLVTGPAIEPVSVAELKKHLNVDHADDDALIDSLGRAARGHVESFTHRPLITQTWDEKRDDVGGEVFELSLAPVISITSVTYVATDGTSTVWSSALYQTDLPSGPKAAPARITPIYSGMWPVARAVMNAWTVRYVAGYGATAASVPYELKAAIKLLVGHWYVHREPVNIGNIVSPIPLTVDSLLWPFKHFV